MNGHTATVVALLDKGADINAMDKVSLSCDMYMAAFQRASCDQMYMYLISDDGVV